MNETEQSFEPDLNYICRLCLKLTENDIQHNIFDEGLSNKIILILNLEISSVDPLPRHICRDCRYQVEKTFHFRQVAKNCDSRLKKHVRLVNQGKSSVVLKKNYQDDDTEELEEMYLQSYVSSKMNNI
jgi:Zinc-finger associated domain (zf-AD)